MEAEDLLQEGFRRALDERNCPVKVDIVRFLAEAMRSIRLKRAKRRPVLVSPPLAGGQPAQAPDAIDPAPNAEERLAAADEDGARERKRQEVIGLFADDLAAQVIVEGMMEGTRGEDLRALTDLDPTAYRSKRRLICRRIESDLRNEEMTTNSNDARDALRRLADALAEDVLNAPDSEILEDAAEIYGDAEKLAADMLKLFEQTASEQGKERLAAARAAVAADRRRPAAVVRLPPAEARRRLQQLIAADPETARKLTAAARKGDRLSDDDVQSMLEDFEELGVTLPNDSEDPEK